MVNVSGRQCAKAVLRELRKRVPCESAECACTISPKADTLLLPDCKQGHYKQKQCKRQHHIPLSYLSRESAAATTKTYTHAGAPKYQSARTVTIANIIMPPLPIRPCGTTPYSGTTSMLQLHTRWFRVEAIQAPSRCWQSRRL